MKSSSSPPQSAHLIQVEKDCSQQQVFPMYLPLALSIYDTSHKQPSGKGSRLLPQPLHSKPSKILTLCCQHYYRKINKQINKILRPSYHRNRNSTHLLSHHRVTTGCNRTSKNCFLSSETVREFWNIRDERDLVEYL